MRIRLFYLKNWDTNVFYWTFSILKYQNNVLLLKMKNITLAFLLQMQIKLIFVEFIFNFFILMATILFLINSKLIFLSF